MIETSPPLRVSQGAGTRPLRIAFAMINCNRRDGSARAVNEVAERLAKRGHDVHLYARKAEDLDFDLVRWHHVGGLGWPEVADFWSYHVAVNRKLSAFRFPLSGLPYAIVHSVGCNTACANVVTIQNVQPAKRQILQRLGHTEQVSLPRRLTRALYSKITCAAEQRLYTDRPGRRPLLFLPVSRGVEAELRAHYHIGQASVRIVPNAADTSVFRPLTADLRASWRLSHGLQPSDFVCIFSGGEWARKGLDLAIRALALIDAPHVKLYVAGDDPACSRFVNLSLQLQLSDRVLFGGFRSDVATALAASDLFLFPSWYEAFSLATIEAAACALPIIATRINGTEDFIQPGVTGEFIEHDPTQIASVLQPLISNLSACRRLGEAGRRLVDEKYTWDRVAELTEQAYRHYLIPRN